jgi:hypothetical protein
VTPKLLLNWLTITKVTVETRPVDGDFVCVRAGGECHDVPWAAGGERLMAYLQSISEDLTEEQPVSPVPTPEEHSRSFADRFSRPAT